MSALLLIVHACAAWFLVGLIWIVQRVHYAQFDGVGTAGWGEYHRRHMSNIGVVVVPAMLVELASAVLLTWVRPTVVPAWMVWVGLALVGLMWVSTAAIQVPLHNRLAGGFDAEIGRRLVATNWLRTIGWTVRGLLAAWMLWLAMRR